MKECFFTYPELYPEYTSRIIGAIYMAFIAHNN